MSFQPQPKRTLARARAIVTNAVDALEREAIRMEHDGEDHLARRIRALTKQFAMTAPYHLGVRFNGGDTKDPPAPTGT